MNTRTLLIAIAALIIILGVAFAYYTTSSETFSPNQQLSEEEIGTIVEAVGRHIILPEGEEPLVATIADITLLLEREPFYRGAKNGDILLLYPNAGKAILYDQEGDILVNVGPIILDQDAEAEAGTGAEIDTAEEEPTIAE